MIKLLGRYYSKDDLKKYFGDFSHIAGIKKFKYSSGRAKGISAVEVKTGGGLSFEVLENRGLDIGLCCFNNMPVSYRSAVKESSEKFFEPQGDEWLRNYGGGLLTTCGLTYLGAPCIDNGESLGLHGRLSNTPAEEFYSKSYWDENDLILEVNGTVREAKALNYNMVLNREIKAKAGENRFFIKDTVVNEGFVDTPNMILYHFNIGHPVLDKGSQLYMETESVVPRDDVASGREDKYNEYLAPTKDYPDVVYYHNLKSSEDDVCTVALVNYDLNLGFYLKFNKDTLPCFTQWKFTGEGNYVTGLEPGNCHVNGRDVEREQGRLKMLKPGEEVTYNLEVGVLSSKDEIEKFIECL